MTSVLAFSFLILGLSAFARDASLNLVKVNASDLPAIAIDTTTAGSESKAALKSALEKQLAQCLKQPQGTSWNFADKWVTRKTWCVKTAQWFLKKLETAATLEEVYQAAKSELEWYQSTGEPTTPEANDVLYTGYYRPTMKAKLKKDKVYRYPFYKLPKDGVAPKFTRAQIVAGALEGKGLEFAYASNPVDPYLLEVQGSGIVLMQNDDGTETSVMANYGASNGFAYASLGKLMRAAGIPESYISLQGIRKYFIDEHPELWEKFSNQNASYVFLKIAVSGPYGSAGVILTPGHSIAVDTSIFPLGAIALVQSEKPTNVTGESVDAWQTFTQFMVSQDTGGAIKGAGHVDIYWGSGDYAQLVAGHSRQIGKLFFCLVP